MLEKKNKSIKINEKVQNEKNFPCNRPKHIKGKVPTQARLEYRRIRDGN